MFILDVSQSTVLPCSSTMADRQDSESSSSTGRLEMEEPCIGYALDGRGKSTSVQYSRAQQLAKDDSSMGSGGISNNSLQVDDGNDGALYDLSGQHEDSQCDVHQQRNAEDESTGITGKISTIGRKVWSLFKGDMVDFTGDRSDMVDKLAGDFEQFRKFLGCPRRAAELCKGINGKIEQRLEFYAKQCRHTNADYSSQVRRILHDSIYFDARNENVYKSFTAFLERIVRSLQGLPWYAISFHPEETTTLLLGAEQNFARLCGINRWLCNGTYNGSIFQCPRSNVCWTGREYWRYIGPSLCKQRGVAWEDLISTKELDSTLLTKGHFHIIHGCNWYNHECRHLSKSFDVSERKRPSIKPFDISEEYFENIFKYIATEPRFLCHLKMSNPTGIHFIYGTEFIQKTDLLSDSSAAKVASSNTQDQERLLRRKRSPSEPAFDRIDRSSHGKRSKSSDDGEDRTKRILQYILEMPTFPLENVLRTKMWDYSDYSTMIASDKVIQRCLFLAQNKYAKWSFKQFEQYYKDTVKYAHWGVTDLDDFNNYYYTVSESVAICEELLDEQLKHMDAINDLTIIERRSHFLNDLYDILEKQRPKVNCFMVISEPSAGKNFFFDAISAWYINVGLIQNFNRYNNFPLMEAINRRINIWNEPNMEPAAFDTVKMLLAGDPLKAAVKYQGEQPLQKTPIIVMTNNECFPNTQAFNDRIVRYRWQRAPFLKKYTKKIHPEAWPNLIYKYVLLNENNNDV